MTLQAVCEKTFKYNAVVVAAALITFLLFYFMQFLISSNNTAFRPPSVTRLIDATMPVIEPILYEEIARPQPIELPQTAPPGDSRDVPELGTRGQQVFTRENLTPPTNDLGSIPLSRHMVPLVRTTAPYPTRALSRGVQGFVELSFTVNEEGRVVDPVVLYAEPEGFFERSALQTIRKWQYSPALEEGVAVPVHDVRQRIVFQLADD